jgi:outer membrane protein
MFTGLRFFSTLLLLIFNILILNGQEAWSLEQCLKHARDNNLVIRQAELNTKLAQTIKQNALEARFPTLSFGTNYGFRFGRTIDPTTNAFENAALSTNGFAINTGLVLYNGGNIQHTIRRTGFDLAAAQMDAKQTANQVALDIASLYLNILLAKENVEIAKYNLEFSKKRLSQVQSLVKNGARLLGDQLEAESQLLSDEQLLVSADNTLLLSKLNLALALQLDDLEGFDVKDYNVQIDEDVLSMGAAEVFKKAEQNQPQVAAARFRTQSALSARRIASSGYFPTITLFGNLNTNFSSLSRRIDRFESVISPATPVLLDGDLRLVQFFQQSPVFANNPYFNQLNQNLGIGVGIQLSVPIYNQGTIRGNVQRAQVQQRQAEIQQEQVVQQLRNEVERARADAFAARKAKEAADKNEVAAQRSFVDTEKRYTNGTVSLFEFNTVQNRLLSARIQAVRAKYDYAFKVKVLEFYIRNDFTF